MTHAEGLFHECEIPSAVLITFIQSSIAIVRIAFKFNELSPSRSIEHWRIERNAAFPLPVQWMTLFKSNDPLRSAARPYYPSASIGGPLCFSNAAKRTFLSTAPHQQSVIKRFICEASARICSCLVSVPDDPQLQCKNSQFATASRTVQISSRPASAGAGQRTRGEANV